MLLEALPALRAHSLPLPLQRALLDWPVQAWHAFMRSRSRVLLAQLLAAPLLPLLLLSELQTPRGVMKRLRFCGWTDSMSLR